MIRRPLARVTPRLRAAALVALALVAFTPAASSLAEGGAAAVGAPAIARWGVLEAQTPAGARRTGGGWTAVRVGKWVLLGATVGFGYYALRQSTRADRAYSDLRHLCVDVRTACLLEGGRYPDARAEALYATSLRRDRRAQSGILGGQVTLLGSAALFVYDLRNVHGPENIPFPGVPPAKLASSPAPRRASAGPALGAAPFAARRGVALRTLSSEPR